MNIFVNAEENVTMRIENLRVYDLEESMIAAGYPMRTKNEIGEVTDKDRKRALNLTKASRDNHAHGQFLTGVRVNFDLTCSNKMWVEAERYRFLEFVSSQSTMHRIAKFDLDNQYNEHVDSRIIEIMKEKVRDYNDHMNVLVPQDMESVNRHAEVAKRKYLEILYSNPAGFELTARMATNYRCLLNIYNQRWNHRLPEWREFCKYMRENLPYFDELLAVYMGEEDPEGDNT